MASGGSSMRNAVKRIEHKERSQPASRKKFGLLEKHKDYVVRAQDYHKKQKIIKNLKLKAELRNPDEFYFGMNTSQVVKGVHKKKQDRHLDTDKVKSLKTQDAGYIIYKKSLDDSKVEKLKSLLHGIGEKASNHHKIFVDDDAELSSFNIAKHFDTPKELVNRAYNRPRRASLEATLSANKASSTAVLKKIANSSKRTYKELEQRAERSEKLGKALIKLDLQRNLLGPGTKRKIMIENNGEETRSSEELAVYKWKRQRKH